MSAKIGIVAMYDTLEQAMHAYVKEQHPGLDGDDLRVRLSLSGFLLWMRDLQRHQAAGLHDSSSCRFCKKETTKEHK